MLHVYEYCWPKSCYGLHACICMVYSVHAHVVIYLNMYKTSVLSANELYFFDRPLILVLPLDLAGQCNHRFKL